MPNNGESPSQRSHSKEIFPETFPEIKINQLRREWQAEMANDIKSLKERVTKLEKKKWWQWKREKKLGRSETSNPLCGTGKKKRTKRRYKKKKRKYKKKRTKKKSL